MKAGDNMGFKIFKGIIILPVKILFSPFWLFPNVLLSDNWAEFMDGWKEWFKISD